MHLQFQLQLSFFKIQRKFWKDDQTFDLFWMPCHLSIIGNRRRYSSRLSIPMFIETPCMKNFFLKSGSGRIIKSLSLAQLSDDSRQFPGNGGIKWKLFFFNLSVFIKNTRAGQSGNDCSFTGLYGWEQNGTEPVQKSRNTPSSRDEHRSWGTVVPSQERTERKRIKGTI